MTVDFVRDAERPHVGHLRIDFGDLNLFTADRAESLREAVTSIPDDVAVVTVAAEDPREGTGGLSAGLDLEWAQELSGEAGEALLETFYETIEAVRDAPPVTVCCCGEYTLGVGFELAAACEFRVATADATLGLPEVDVGLPTVIHGGLVLRLVGEGVANELIYTGETIEGTRAADLGIITRAAEAGSYGDEVDDLVEALAEKSPRVLQSQKRVMRKFRSNGLEAGMEASVADAGRAFGSADQREAMAAFLEDREPEFQG